MIERVCVRERKREKHLFDSGGGDRFGHIDGRSVPVCVRERKREKHLFDSGGGDRFGHIDGRSVPAVRPQLAGGGG